MYITVSDLGIPDEALIRLTDDEGTGSVNTGRAEAAISSAQSLVDCALSRLYTTPLASPPELVRKLTRDLAVYNLYLRVGSLPDWVKASYTAAVGELENAACGILCIGIDPPSPWSMFQAGEREFSRGRMEGF